MENKEIEKYKLELKNLSLESAPGFKTINCTSCSKPLPSENLNINDKIAKCNDCNIVFSFEQEITDLQKQGKRKTEILRPEGIDIFRFQEDLDISIKQPLTAIEIIAISLLPFLTLIFTLLFWKEKVSFIYPAINWLLMFLLAADLFNRSNHKVHLSVGEKFLSIKWRPKKMSKDKYYPVDEIDQIYTTLIPGNHISIFMILNKTEGQKHVKLLSGLDNLSKARYLEQEIEYHLGIEDRKVPEELS
ncbi:MAG: hypothetical protein AB8F74_03240 [Saprospiraceae bacterium]